ncbi:hypothetical protein F5Y12DRAFT_514736 [Xylaria sp. FL1777]|nr:hypothetical protein F5Y12DRAFT_514736 [Xylaria sp. FL1777]
MDPTLPQPNDVEHARLYKILWHWGDVCEHCSQGRHCRRYDCPWKRLPRLRTFSNYYTKITRSYRLEYTGGGGHRAISSHDDVISIIELLKQFPDTPRRELIARHFPKQGSSYKPRALKTDESRAFDLAVRTMTMVNCATEGDLLRQQESGTVPLIWRDGSTLASFLHEAFPWQVQHVSQKVELINDKGPAGKASQVKASLTAELLKKVAKLTLEPTDDLKDHLKMDIEKRELKIYHHTSVLKEHLAATMEVPITDTEAGRVEASEVGTSGSGVDSPDRLEQAQVNKLFSNAIKRGNIPRPIALEVLDSLQKILFPPNTESEQILKSLVRQHALDQDCKVYDHGYDVYRRRDEDDIDFVYFGARLVELYDEMQNPTAHGSFERALQRVSGARYVMLATLVGVFIAVVLGILGLAVGVFQAWVAYQAWRYPVSPPSGG